MAPKHAVDKVDLIDAILGLDSDFHRTHGFYVHGVPLETAILPEGWERRVVRLRNQNTRENTGWCVEAHDLAASKLVAYRDKDRDFVRALLAHELVKPSKLRLRIGQLPADPTDPQRHDRLRRWLDRTVKELRAAESND